MTDPKPVQPVRLTRAALFFAVVAVLGILVGTLVPFFTVVGVISAIIAVAVFLLWWINKRNGRDV